MRTCRILSPFVPKTSKLALFPNSAFCDGALPTSSLGEKLDASAQMQTFRSLAVVYVKIISIFQRLRG